MSKLYQQMLVNPTHASFIKRTQQLRVLLSKLTVGSLIAIITQKDLECRNERFCFNSYISFFLSTALAASGGQLPLSTLEGGSKVMLGSSGGQGGGLPSSLFLNHPSLLHMGQNPGAGLVSAAIAKVSQSSPFPSASSISPTPCSPSPCSSPASSCSSSEMAHSPSSLGGPKIE